MSQEESTQSWRARLKETTPVVLGMFGKALQRMLVFLLRCLAGVLSFLRGVLLRLWGWLTRAMPWLGKAFQSAYQYLSPRVQNVASRIWRRIRMITRWLWRSLLFVLGLTLRSAIKVLLYAGPIVLGFWSFGAYFPNEPNDYTPAFFLVCCVLPFFAVWQIHKRRYRWMRFLRRPRVATRHVQPVVAASSSEAQLTRQKEQAVQALIEDLRR